MALPFASRMPARPCRWSERFRPAAFGESELAAGQCLEIMTGAPCPAGTEAVVKKEDVQRHGNQVRLPAMIEPGQHIAPQGSECRSGQPVLAAGEIVTPLAVAVMATVGVASGQSDSAAAGWHHHHGQRTGAAGRPSGAGQIRDSNAPMLVAMAEGLGIKRPRQLRTPDRLELILAALDRFAEMDIVLLAGGVSVGTYDMVPRPCGVRRRSDLPQGETEARQASALGPQGSATPLRFAGQPDGLPLQLSSLCCRRDPRDGGPPARRRRSSGVNCPKTPLSPAGEGPGVRAIGSETSPLPLGEGQGVRAASRSE